MVSSVDSEVNAMYLKADGGWTRARNRGVSFVNAEQAEDAAKRLRNGETWADVAKALAPQFCRLCLFMRDLSVVLELTPTGPCCPNCRRLATNDSWTR
jgi:hypothetical protein